MVTHSKIVDPLYILHENVADEPFYNSIRTWLKIQ
jgi:hypothetical protein